MSQSEVLTILKNALFTALALASPLLVGSILVGLIISILQAATQVNEQTLTFVPKIIVIAVILLALGGWMMTVSVDFFNEIVSDMVNYTK